MQPVSAWPPGSPGASLSPFGKPRQVCVGQCGFVIPHGAWVVSTTTNSVVMYFPCVPGWTNHPHQAPGTGLRPGQTHRPNSPFARFRYGHPGRQPPNWYGWKFVPAPSSTLVQPNSAGLVIADGQNVVINGTGFATITQAYSV